MEADTADTRPQAQALPEQLAPGVRRLRPDDHFMILSETDAAPMHIGALIWLEAPPAAGRAGVFERLAAHIEARLPLTPLLVELRQSPEGYDSDVWVDLADLDRSRWLTRVSDPLDEAGVLSFIARRVMQRLDLEQAPFHVDILDGVTDGRVAIYLRAHHAVTDGVGFQTILGLLSDETPPFRGRRDPGALPAPDAWRAMAEARFEAETPLRIEKRARQEAALAKLKSGELAPRAVTPALKLSGPTSTERAYATLSLPLARIKALAQAFGGTINDVFLAVAAAALRRYLLEIDDLPPTPLVINSARSYRRPEHGDFGNRIVALHPHLATTLADPVERLRAIQAAMADERARTAYDEAMLDAPEKPFGARDRREKFASRTSGGGQVLPGNVTLSNVPGPPGERSMAGLRVLGNYPAPLLGSGGRFFNITSRRNGEMLDMGLMADPTKIADVDRMRRYVVEALEEYEALKPGA
ncbi:MAG: hypothetical protein JWQ97_98 [Phenylobacterium sp.]|nr:hypothetical protein [Phenylobacterium sp.]